MRPGFSIIFLTTLIGAGQGLFLALYSAELAGAIGLLSARPEPVFFVGGALLSLLFTGMGAVSSLFHLGHPERAWRALSMWRTSWLSREGIAMLGFMALLSLYAAGHYLQSPLTLVTGSLTALLCLALFICTSMIYACIRFLQEWAHPLTVVNYILLGCASGFTLATAFSAFTALPLVAPYGAAAIGLTLLGLLSRSASLLRNSRIRPRSSLQTAIGIHHPHIVQKSQGLMGGSYNTREFFHGHKRIVLRSIKWFFLGTAFVLPTLMLSAGLPAASTGLLCAAFLLQYSGLIAERWFFFAQANHPQNLYYQAIS